MIVWKRLLPLECVYVHRAVLEMTSGSLKFIWGEEGDRLEISINGFVGENLLYYRENRFLAVFCNEKGYLLHRM